MQTHNHDSRASAAEVRCSRACDCRCRRPRRAAACDRQFERRRAARIFRPKVQPGEDDHRRSACRRSVCRAQRRLNRSCTRINRALSTVGADGGVWRACDRCCSNQQPCNFSRPEQHQHECPYRRSSTAPSECPQLHSNLPQFAPPPSRRKLAVHTQQMLPTSKCWSCMRQPRSESRLRSARQHRS